MPPMNWERAVFGLMTRPTANTPSTRLRRTSPLSASTRTSTNCAPNAWRESSACALISSPVWTETSPSPCASSASQARTTAVPHEAVPIEPPAIAALAEVGVADLEPQVLGVDAERVGGDLGQHRAGAGADVGGGDLDRVAAVGLEARGRLGR